MLAVEQRKSISREWKRSPVRLGQQPFSADAARFAALLPIPSPSRFPIAIFLVNNFLTYRADFRDLGLSEP
jgi:hypothetical protein